MGTHGKRKSRATVAGVLLLLIAVLTLAACGGSSITASSSPSAAPSQATASPSVASSPSETPLPTPTVAGTIAFARGGDDTDICVVNTDGTGLKFLAGGKEPSLYPRWSPDGKRIVYEEDQILVNRQDVWVMNADGSGKTPITDDANMPITSRLPSWSPDQKALAIAGLYDAGATRLFIVNSDGTGLSAVPGVDAARDPSWRPR
jgi:Tol biopolymer transport system component